MNEWSGSKLDSKICDLYCRLRMCGVAKLETLVKLYFPHIKFNEIPEDVCVRNYKLMNPKWPNNY